MLPVSVTFSYGQAVDFFSETKIAQFSGYGDKELSFLTENGHTDVRTAQRRGGEKQEDQVASGDFPAQSTARWNRAGEETPGGPAVLEDESGRLQPNFKRFSEPAEIAMELRWWDKKMIWEVLGEPTGHEVLVLTGTVNVYRVHALVSTAIIALGVLGLVAFGGVPLWLGALGGVLLALVCFGALAAERRTLTSLSGAERVDLLDRTVWEMMLSQCRTKVLPNTKAGQEALYAEAVALKKAEHAKRYGDPDTGKVGKTWANPETGRVEQVPKFEVDPRLKEEFCGPGTRVSNETAATQILRVLDNEARGLAALDKHYEKHPAQAESKGRGAKGCNCAACRYNAEHGVVPRLSGVEAYREAVRLRNKKRRAVDAGEAVGMSGGPLNSVARSMLSRLGASEAAKEINADGDVVDPRAVKARKKLERDAKKSRAARASDKGEAVPAEPRVRRIESLAPVAEPEADDVVEEASEPEGPSRGTGEGSVVDGYDDLSELDRAPRRRGKRSRMLALGLLGAVGVVLVALAAVVALSGTGEQKQDDLPIYSSTPPSSSQAPSSSVPQAPPTGTEKAGTAIKFGPDAAGDQASGPGAIAGYEHAYYVPGPDGKRSAVRAQDFYAPGARGDSARLQQAMDANPTGTSYDLKVTPIVPGDSYDVELTIKWPGQAPLVSKQRFFVTYVDGKFFILRAEQL